MRIQSFLCIAVENELLSVILRRFAVPLFLSRTKFALEEDYDNFPNPIRQGANGPSVTKFLPLAYSFPPTSERSNARCVSIQQGSAVHRCACFISLPVRLRSHLGCSKHQYFIESSN